MNRKLRGAIIGFGNVAANAHLQNFQNSDKFEIVSVVEKCSSRIGIARKLLPHAEIFSDLNSLIKNIKIDFVDICTPPCCHLEETLISLEAGLHVLCEKPLVTSLNEINQIIMQLEKSKKVLYTVNNWKYAPIWKKVFEIINKGGIGRIHSASLNVLRPQNSGGGATNWRKCIDISGGGIMVDHGWHHLYILFSLMNAMPDTVSAKMSYVENGSMIIEETAEVDMLFKDSPARLYLTWQADCRRNFGVIKGEKAELLLNDDNVVLSVAGKEKSKTLFEEPLSGGSHHPEWMKPVMDGFYRNIETGDFFSDNVREALNCVKLIELSYQSHRRGSKALSVD